MTFLKDFEVRFEEREFRRAILEILKSFWKKKFHFRQPSTAISTEASGTGDDTVWRSRRRFNRNLENLERGGESRRVEWERKKKKEKKEKWKKGLNSKCQTAPFPLKEPRVCALPRIRPGIRAPAPMTWSAFDPWPRICPLITLI